MHYKLMTKFKMAPADDGGGGNGTDPLFDSGTPPPGTPPATPPATPPVIPPPTPGDEWKKDWPQELKDAPYMKNFKNPLDVAQALANAQKMIGADKIALPSKHATKEEIVGIFRKLGSPEKIEDFKYDLAVADSVDKGFMDSINKIAHENGMLPSQAKAIMDTFAKLNTDAYQAQKTQADMQRDQGLKKLQTDWGDAYPNEIARARAAMMEFATEDERKQIQAMGLGSNPTVLRMLAKVGATLSEDKIRGSGGSGQGGPLTPEDARAQRNAIMQNMNHPYYQKDHPEHAAAKAEVSKLFEYEAGKGRVQQNQFSVKIN